MRPCAACGSDRISVLRDDLRHEYVSDGRPAVWPYRLLQCDSCGMGFVDPEPSLDLLNTFYGAGYDCYVGGGEYSPLKRRMAAMRMAWIGGASLRTAILSLAGMGVETLTGRTVSACLGVPLNLPRTARILDLGYGGGAWLMTMAGLNYRDLHGYDIDANSENAARLSSAGIRVSGGAFLSNDYPLESFDCIRMCHVFEHLIDPIEVLRKCHAMLRPGGVLVMEHPCLRSWVAAWNLDSSPLLQLPKHLYHHTPRSTSLMLRSAGFAPREVKPYAVIAQLSAMLDNRRRRAAARRCRTPSRRSPPLIGFSASPRGAAISSPPAP